MHTYDDVDVNNMQFNLNFDVIIKTLADNKM